MKRRLSIGRALLSDPQMLLLDEPTLGVDVQSTHRIWDYIKALRDLHKTVIVTTNTMSEAEALGDEIIIIDRGRKVCQGQLSALKAAYGHDHIIIQTATPVAEDTLNGLFPAYTMGPSGEIIVRTEDGEKDLLRIAEQVKPYAEQVKPVPSQADLG